MEDERNAKPEPEQEFCTTIIAGDNGTLFIHEDDDGSLRLGVGFGRVYDDDPEEMNVTTIRLSERQMDRLREALGAKASRKEIAQS